MLAHGVAWVAHGWPVGREVGWLHKSNGHFDFPSCTNIPHSFTPLIMQPSQTGELLSTIRGHEVCWTSSHDGTFYITVQEDSKVLMWDQQDVS